MQSVKMVQVSQLSFSDFLVLDLMSIKWINIIKSLPNPKHFHNDIYRVENEKNNDFLIISQSYIYLHI